MAQSSRTYFAATNRKDIGKALSERLQLLIADTRDNRAEMRNAYAHIYGRDVGAGITSGVTRGGDRGELAVLRVNSSTATGRARHSVASAAKLTWKAQAKDGTGASAAATGLAAEVLEDEWKTKGMAVGVSKWLKYAIQFSEWFMLHEWDRSAGPPLVATENQLRMQGDLVYHQVPPWNVYRDNSASSWEACQWNFVRRYRNRFDLARMYTQLPDGKQGREAEEAIINASETTSAQWAVDDKDRLRDSDLIPVWHFFHHPSAALPMGRHLQFIGGELVLEDEPIRGPRATYEGVPLYRLADEDMVDSPHAWCLLWDTFGAQEVKDSIHTAVATRATTLSNPIIALESGSDMHPDVLGNGWRSWKYQKGSNPPKEVEFRPVQKEMLEYDQALDSAIRFILGMNDVSMGQQSGSEMNAQAFAIMDSIAVRQASPLQDNWVQAVSKLGTGVLKTLAKRVVRERSLSSGGKAKKWTGDALKAVDLVFVEIGNPMEQSAAGRMTITDAKLEKGFITTAEQYDQCLATGRSDAVTHRNTAEMTLVQRENDMLKRGELPPVHFWQNHQLHYRENSAAGLESEDENVIAAVTKHLDEHYFALFGVDKGPPVDPATGQPAVDPMTGQPMAGDPLGPLRERWLLGMQPGPGQEQPMMAPTPGAPMPGAPPGEPPPAEGDAAAAMAPPEGMEPVDIPPVVNPTNGQAYDPAAPVPAGGLQ